MNYQFRGEALLGPFRVQAGAAWDVLSVLVRFKANHPYGATRWLMKFGSAAEVLAPDVLRQEIRRQFQEAASRYS
jgi:predicted DNA-binding transcriptional regulator YafY